jgi:hypothetical protein
MRLLAILFTAYQLTDTYVSSRYVFICIFMVNFFCRSCSSFAICDGALIHNIAVASQS